MPFLLVTKRSNHPTPITWAMASFTVNTGNWQARL
jgi:hypothetical protein